MQYISSIYTLNANFPRPYNEDRRRLAAHRRLLKLIVEADY